MKNAIGVGVFVLALIAIAFLVLYAESRSEVVRCNELKQQATQYAGVGFFLTPAEDSMCKTHDIEINAPVKDESTEQSAD